MTAIEKVLLRKDIASIIVAIVVGSATTFFLAGLTGPIVSQISFSDQFQGQGVPMGDLTVQSTVSFLLQVIALELLLRIVIFVRRLAYKRIK